MKGFSGFVQSPVADPTKSQVNTVMTGTKVFKKNASAAEIASGVIDITGWFAIIVTPTANSTYYFNGENTKIDGIDAGTKTTIIVSSPKVTQVTIVFGTAIAANSVQGM